MVEYKAVKVGLDPSPEQERVFRMYAGAARFAYNKGLDHVREQLNNNEEKIDWTHFSLNAWWNHEGRDQLAPWWPEVSNEVFSYAFQNLGKALSNFSKSKKGQRKGRQVGFPKGKSRKAKKSFQFGRCKIADDYGLKLPRIGRVHTFRNLNHLIGDHKMKTTTISYQGNRWYASILIEVEDYPEVNIDKIHSVGVDVGIKELATLSDGRVFENKAPLREAMKDLKHASRALSRKEKGSANFYKQVDKIRRLHAKVSNIRQYEIHQLTAFLVENYTDICIEDLNVSGMMATPKPKKDPENDKHYLRNGRSRKRVLARNVVDSSFAEFRTQLEYKARMRGVRIHYVDRFYPSSKTCSNCGFIKKDLKLSDRTYVCPECGFTMDRDLNAAKNIEKEAMRRWLEEVSQG